MTNNTDFRLIIRGINKAGLHTDVTSPLIIPIEDIHGLGAVSDGHDPSVDIDYLANTSDAHATWKGFETPEVKIRAYFFAVGSCTRGNYHVTNNQFIPVTPPTATSFGVRGLHLVNGQRYCIKIKAENLAGIESDIASSDGFVVDVSPPDMRQAMVLDGQGDDDIDHQPEDTGLSVTWTGIRDHESGIQHFEVAVSRNRAGQPDVTSFIDVGHNTSSTITGLRLDSEVYYIIVCAVNNAGLRSCLASDGVLVDPTPPTSGIVHDGILEPDIRYQATTHKMSANWEQIWDLESRIEKFEWAIGEGGADQLVQEFVDAGLQTHVTSKKALNLKHGHNYTVFLRIHNRAGVMTDLSSNGVIIDTTPPVPTEILPRLSPLEWRFSKETGTYYSSTASDIHVTWNHFEETESEMWYYKWSVGTSKYGTQIQPLINVGYSTNANTSGSELNIREGIRFFVSVVGRNRVNLVSGNCSKPFLIDYSPPRTGTLQVKSTSGIKKDFFRMNEDIRVIWSGFEDLQSGIEKYELHVFNGSRQILNYTRKSSDVELDVLINKGLISPGKGYEIVLKAINYAGLQSFVSSMPLTIDNTPPFYTGKKNELPKRYFLPDPTLFHISWDAFEDRESSVESYEIGIGTRAFSDDIYTFIKTNSCTQFSFSDLVITDNRPYYVTVKAYNMAGIVSSLLLEEIIFDQSAPTGNNESVKDGLVQEDIDYISSGDTVSATLTNVEDLESGISEIEYCVGTTSFNCVIKPFTSIYPNKSFVCMDCEIDPGMTAFAIFRVRNGAGLSAIFVSDGVTVDLTPPEIQSVYDGKTTEPPDVEKTHSDWTPTVTWHGARDVQSGLRNCQWMIVKKENNTTNNVYVKTLHEANTTYEMRHTEKADRPLALTKNSLYFNVIQCWNKAGITSYQYSNGWSVVEQWPIPSYVIDGLEPYDIKYDVNGETLGASWGAFRADSKDPIVKYEWAVGTFGEFDNALEFTDVGFDTRVSISLSESDIILRPGVEYFTTVRATTLSGWTANVTSNGFVVDKTSPTAGIVKVDHRISNVSTNAIDYILSWEGFADPQTGIQSYAYCLGYIKDVCATTVFNAGLAVRGTVQGFHVEAKDIPFYGIVIATNEAGLKTIISSDSVKIDFTPPVTGTILDGTDSDLDYMNSTVSLATTWSAFVDPESGIKKCTLTVSEENSISNDSMTTKFESDINATGSIIHDILLIPGFRYVSTISCENFDGFKSSKSSSGVMVDDSPPIAGKLLDKNGQPFDQQYQSSTSELRVRWTDGYDPESGVMEYLIAVGSGSNEDDVREFSSVGLTKETVVKNLTMSSGLTYFVTLKIVNKAGLTSKVSSNGITIDATPPEIQEVCVVFQFFHYNLSS